MIVSCDGFICFLANSLGVCFGVMESAEAF